MKRIISVLLIVIMFSSFALNEWETVFNQDGIQLSTREADCKLETGSNQKWLLVKVQNNSPFAKIVEWDIESFNTEGKCINCGTKENHRLLKIGPNESIEGICSIKTVQELKFAMKMLDIKTVSGVKEVKLVNIKVTNVQHEK